MFGYYMRLALLSFRRTPGLTVLMVLAVAAGISVCVMSLTLYHAISGNPIWWKSHQLYAVTMDSWDPERPHDDKHPDLAPPQLTYKDATYLAQSKIPTHRTVMFKTAGVVSADSGGPKADPYTVVTRVTTGDFFTMFDVPFQYGHGWNAAADEGPEPVVVISKEVNDKFFGGENSVGRTLRWNDRAFRVIGVLDFWQPAPKFYDLNNGTFDAPENVYLPFRWGETLELEAHGNVNCWKPENLTTFKQFLNSECVWVQMWVELPDSASRERMQTFMDSYWDEQHKVGRFPRKRNNRLTDVDQWLLDQHVVQSDNRVLVGLAFAFLAVCLINTVGLLLAKFLNGAALAGVRRALGASRRALFMQHMVEVGLIALSGAILGLGLAWLGLRGVRALSATATVFNKAGIQALAHIDATSLISAIVLALVATFVAGLYPAWRIGRVSPAVYLKNQ
ncbi:MAG TPA: ABC transporter permease [Steroidobacteraceae bacterium]|jgi:putative ABC transport system permease protein|nr:ABC transporter permease [Steroidobacteraceae bacterium]